MTDIIKKLPLPIDAPRLPDNKQWTNRFYVKSETSNNLYTVAQHKTGRFWACSCRGYIRHKHCKHLDSLGLPGRFVAFEPKRLRLEHD